MYDITPGLCLVWETETGGLMGLVVSSLAPGSEREALSQGLKRIIEGYLKTEFRR